MSPEGRNEGFGPRLILTLNLFIMADLNWNNRYEVVKQVKEVEIPYLLECLVDDIKPADSQEAYDAVHELIDGHEFVIYNYQAKKLTEAFDMDVFEESPITGERYSSYNVMAYEKLEELFFEAYDLDEIFDA